MPYLRDKNIKDSIDWLTIGLYAVLVIMGWISVYGASYDFDQSNNVLDFSQRYSKQLLWIALGGIIGVCILVLDSRIFNHYAYFIYLFFILLLLATLVLATEIKGSRSWLVFGPVSIQPAEFAKFATALTLAKFMSSYNFRFNLKNSVIAATIVLLPLAIIILQKETGTALVFLAFMLVFYREGMSGFFLALVIWAVLLFILIIRLDVLLENGTGNLGRFVSFFAITIVQIILAYVYGKDRSFFGKLLLGNAALFAIAILINATKLINVNFEYVALFSIVASSVLYIVFSILHRKANYLLIVLFMLLSVGYCYSVDYIFDNVLQPHQQVRIKVSLGIENDLSGAGYNVNQSKIAIGSGGFWGKGALSGTQTKLKYVPEQDTDFIFCTVGEEFGFWGTTLVLTLFMALLLRLVFVAERQRSVFSRIYGYCVVSIMFFHVAINVGMVIGIMPVIGIPLPFFSYGGSSLWGFTFLLFVLLRLDMNRSRTVF